MAEPRADEGRRRRWRPFLITLVLVAGALTTWLVASVIGPSIFSDHLQRAGDTHTAEETRHVEEAFASALVLSVSLALLASVLAALAVSLGGSGGRRAGKSITAPHCRVGMDGRSAIHH